MKQDMKMHLGLILFCSQLQQRLLLLKDALCMKSWLDLCSQETLCLNNINKEKKWGKMASLTFKLNGVKAVQI